MCENASVVVNIIEHAIIYLKKQSTEYARILNARILNMFLPYRYNKIIIIVTNVIILELLSARSVHLGALLLFYLSLTRI